jgi:hypothetical protein
MSLTVIVFLVKLSCLQAMISLQDQQRALCPNGGVVCILGKTSRVGSMHPYLRFFDLFMQANFSAEMCSWANVGGVMGRSEPPAGGQPVPLYYSNPDIIYANEFPAPRFGQGCFAAALDAVYAAVSLCSFWLQNACMMIAAQFACWSCVTLLLRFKILVTSLSCSTINACNLICSLMSAFGMT